MLADRIQAGAVHLRRSLDASTAAEWPRGAIEMLSPGTEGRAVAAYSTPCGRFVGKFYSDDLGRHGAATQRTIRDRLGEWPRKTALGVPAVISYEPQLRCLLQEYAPGRPFDPAASHPERRRYLHLAGRALAELHALPPLDAPCKTLTDHLGELVRPQPAELIREYQEYGTAVRAAVDRMLELEAGWPETPVTPLHRDFHVRQLRQDGSRMWVLDWDAAANGDPAFDVAYLIVYLENHLDEPLAGEAIRDFTAGYLETGDPGVLPRIGAYKIFNFLRRACRRVRLRDSGWQREVRRMLTRMRSATLLA